MRFRDEEGQSVILVALGMSLFLIGAVGLAVDGSHMYAQRQMAQSAADAAAIAGMMSIFDGTNSTSAHPFSTASGFTCTTTDLRTPCVYASDNGFGGTASDTVTIAYPAGSTVPGVTLSATDAAPLIQVTVSRSVSTTLIQFLGPSAATVSATAVAGITTITSPTPILVTDPTNSGTLSMNGSTSIQICGGPTQSIQVNSSSSTAYGSGGTIDLSKAGPADPGNCTTGTGANFGVFGGAAANPGSVSLGTTGSYIAPSSPIQDPLAGMSAPSVPAAAAAKTSVGTGVDGCVSGPCDLYSPGLYVGGISTKNATVLFKPGVYYMQGGGFTMKNTTGGGINDTVMCVGCTADPNTGTGMMIYDTGPSGSTTGSNPAGGFTMSTGVNVAFQGPTNTATVNGNTVPGPPYYGVLFFEDRTADAQTHTLGQGNGCFTLMGTIYITNTLAIMQADSTHHQVVDYHGTPCSGTINEGDIIAGQLSMQGNSSISMGLYPYGFLKIRQVALVQ